MRVFSRQGCLNIFKCLGSPTSLVQRAAQIKLPVNESNLQGRAQQALAGAEPGPKIGSHMLQLRLADQLPWMPGLHSVIRWLALSGWSRRSRRPRV